MKHEAVIIILGLLALLGSWLLTRTDTPPCVGMPWECHGTDKEIRP